MTSMGRVTYSQLAASSLRGMQGNLQRFSRVQEQLSSGVTISRPSDDPTGTINSMTFKADIAKNEQYARSADDGGSWLQVTDTALMAVDKLANEVKVAALQGKSTGNSDASARSALAAQVDQMRSQLLVEANRTYLGRPVFGGTTSGGVAFDATTGAYTGDAGTVDRTVGKGVKIRVDTPGETTFGTGNAQLFKIADDIATHLRTDPTLIDGDLTRLETAMSTYRSAQADVGARTNRIEGLNQSAKDRVDAAKNSVNNIEGVDIPEATVTLQMQQVAYQAALSTAGKVLQMSLNNFLK